MERVKGLLRNLRLSEAELAGIRIIGKEMEIGEGVRTVETESKSLAKVFSEKLVSAEGLKQALGPIWCPIRGICCKRSGENIFSITFL